MNIKQNSQYFIKNIKYTLILSLIFATFFLLGGERASAATLSVSPSSSSVTNGQNFNVDILLDTAGVSVDGVDVFSLRYNPAILQVQDANTGADGIQITPGILLPITLVNSVNATNGTLQFSQVATGGSSFNGSGKLATITFRGISNGTSAVTIDFSSGSASDSNVAGGGIERLTGVNNASYTIVAPP
ncbi:MAG TPA: cohesin domain-containing protein, partial [Candidatus Paceibacterota bacterium]